MSPILPLRQQVFRIALCACMFNSMSPVFNIRSSLPAWASAKNFGFLASFFWFMAIAGFIGYKIGQRGTLETLGSKNTGNNEKTLSDTIKRLQGVNATYTAALSPLCQNNGLFKMSEEEFIDTAIKPLVKTICNTCVDDNSPADSPISACAIIMSWNNLKRKAQEAENTSEKLQKIQPKYTALKSQYAILQANHNNSCKENTKLHAENTKLRSVLNGYNAAIEDIYQLTLRDTDQEPESDLKPIVEISPIRKLLQIGSVMKFSAMASPVISSSMSTDDE
jgi:regulator of replication initiation timing